VLTRNIRHPGNYKGYLEAMVLAYGDDDSSINELDRLKHQRVGLPGVASNLHAL